MKVAKWRETLELIGIGAVVLSLVMVTYELRLSTAVDTAQAVFDVITVLDEAYRARAQDPNLDELVEKGHFEPDTLSERERSQFHAWLRPDMNVTEAMWFYQNRAIIPQQDMDG